MLQGFAAVNKRLSSGGVLTGTLHVEFKQWPMSITSITLELKYLEM